MKLMNTVMSRFTIVSYNVCGVNNPIRQAELRIFLSQHQPSVLVLQEPKLNHHQTIKKKGKVYPHTPSPPPTFHNYTACNFKHPSQPTSILMYIHKSCTFLPLHNIPHDTPYRPNETRSLLGFVWVSSPPTIYSNNNRGDIHITQCYTE